MSYKKHLSKDPLMAGLVKAQGELQLKERKDIYIYLCYSIMSQQLSTKVADVLRQRFLNIYGGKVPKPEEILATDPTVLRGIGLSNAKVQYVLNVAAFEQSHGMSRKILDSMDDDAVKAYLTQIKGVGKWTAEMLLMFALGRADVFAPDDLGIQQAMCKLYKISSKDKKKMQQRMIKIAEQWRPYRTYACMHLWRWKDA